jgi:hypothetical protein
LLGHALRKAVGVAAQAWDTSAKVIMEEAGLVLEGHRSLKAALDLIVVSLPRARALRLVLEEVERWKSWLEQQQRLSAQESLLQEIMETIAQIVEQDIEPDLVGGLGGRRIKRHVARDRRISIEDQAMRHVRKSSSKTFNGFKEHFVVDRDGKVPGRWWYARRTSRSMRRSSCYRLSENVSCAIMPPWRRAFPSIAP